MFLLIILRHWPLFCIVWGILTRIWMIDTYTRCINHFPIVCEVLYLPHQRRWNNFKIDKNTSGMYRLKNSFQSPFLIMNFLTQFKQYFNFLMERKLATDNSEGAITLRFELAELLKCAIVNMYGLYWLWIINTLGAYTWCLRLWL